MTASDYPTTPDYPTEPDGRPQPNLTVGPPRRPRTPRTRILAGVAVAVVVAFIVLSNTVGRHSTSASRTSTPIPSDTFSEPSAHVAPIIAGWQGVLSRRENVAYDVPPGWKVETSGTLVGFEDEDGKPLALMHGVATYEDGVCPGDAGSSRGHTGFVTAGNADPAKAPSTAVQIFAKGYAYNDDATSAPISKITTSSVKIDQGAITAPMASVTVGRPASTTCTSPRELVVSVAFPVNSSTTAVFVGYFDEGLPDALPMATLNKIISSLRPYRG